MTHDVVRGLRAPDQSNQGRTAGGMGADATDCLAALDATADTIRAWTPLLIPGLLQTGAYSAAAIRSRTPSLPDTEVARRTEHRVHRTQAFLRRWSGEQGGFAWFLMGEAALTQSVAPLDVHTSQIEHLLTLTDRYPRIVVQVLPDDASTAGTAEPFSIHALADGPRVGHLETIIGGWYTTRPEDLTRLYAAFSVLGKWALSRTDTRRAITAWLTECGTNAGAVPRT
ncbi:DUF5753 domain-containing protein [Streptomyces sp. NPDC048516]|uniref:DUF5753 domain-containing protein n=1 Tax=Streptomyces sp. NPDC048516 TaxID=3365565 RepID=UPI003720415A